MNKKPSRGQASILATVVLALLSGGGIIKLFTDVAVNTRDIEITQGAVAGVEDAVSFVEDELAELARQQSFINGKLDTLLIINNINPQYIESRIEKNFAATTTP